MSYNNENNLVHKRYGAGLGSTGQYLVSGIPYITGSSSLAASGEHTIEFPSVTKAVTVISRGSSDIRVHFASKDTGNTISGLHYTTLKNDGDSITFNVKCANIYISNADGSSTASYEVLAELTGIPRGEMFELNRTGQRGISE